MSDYERYSGRLEATGQSLTEFLLSHLKEEYQAQLAKHWNDEDELFSSLYQGDTHVLIKGEVYAFVEKEAMDYDETVMWRLQDGSLAFSTTFYNGACDLQEALEWGFKDIKET